MIRYALSCEDGHEFDSWFATAESFEALSVSGHLACPECGGTEIAKTLMAPGIRSSRTKTAAPPTDDTPLSAPRNAREAALTEMRRKIESESDYVGVNFVAEARAMHDGTKPTRSIYGEARLDEAKRLIEDGVPVAPLPFRPRSRAN